jgi:PAS domain S-box-containing protein
MAVRVLMVDDDPVHLELSERFLTRQSEDYEIITVETFAEALGMLDSSSFDVAVCDIDLAEKNRNGLDILEHIRSEGRSTPVIIFTGKSREEFAIQALNLGADYYIRKSSTNIENLYAELSYYILTAVEKQRTKKALAEAEMRAQTILDTAGTVIVTFNENLEITTANRKASEVLEYTEEELIGMNWVESFLLEKDRKKIGQYLQDLLAGRAKPDEKEEGPIITKSGKQKIIEWYDAVLKDANGNAIGIISAGPEVTERKIAEHMLREERDKAERYLELADTVLLALDTSFRVTMINRKGCELLACNEESVIGQDWVERFVSEKYQEDAREYLRGLLSNPESRGIGCTVGIQSSGGHERLIECHDRVITDSHGKPTSILCSAREVAKVEGTELVVEPVIAKSWSDREHWWQDIFDSTPVAVSIYNEDGLLVDVNQSCMNLMGASDRESLAGLNLFKDLQMPEDMLERIQSGERTRFNYNLDLKNLPFNSKRTGSILVEAILTPVKSDDSIHSYIVHMTDTTAKSRIEKAVRTNEEMFRTIFNESPICIELFDSDGILVSANKAALDLFGISDASDFIGFDLFSDPNTPDFVKTSLKAGMAVKAETRFDFSRVKMQNLYKTSKQGIMHLDSVFSPLKYGEDLSGFIIHIQDITEKHLAEEALKQSRESFKELYNNALTGLFRVRTSDGMILECNDQFALILGHQSREELIDGNSFFRQFLTKSTIWDNLKHDLRNQERITTEIQIATKDSNQIWARLSLRAISEKGYIEGVMADITQEKEALEKLRKQKGELSDFAHSMAHDLKNIFHNMLGFIELIEDENDFRHLQRLKVLLKETGELVDHSVMLADSGLIVEAKDTIDLNSLVREVAESIIPSSIEYTQDELPAVEADEKKVAQIIRNIIDNAIRHGNPKKIDLRFKEDAKEKCIEVSNDGREIPPEVRGRIFNRGFTTSASGQGFGLTIVKRLVEAHGWTIELVDCGETTFRICMPKE